jgi:two-component system, chemotaxis family, protein-glutamate methylesterase/glutaminase
VPAPPRILVCEDSETYARGLTRFLQTDGELEVVAVCASGEQALEAVPRLTPDLVTMDLELSGMDGVRAVEEIMRSHAVPILVLSAHGNTGSPRVAEALEAGAVEAVSKAGLRLDDPDGDAAVELRRRVGRLARRGVRRGLAPARPPRGHPTVVGVCASTGGPRALVAVLSQLPAEFPLPVLVVQHITAGFLDGLIDWLDDSVPLPVALAEGGQDLRPGVWFAPDDAHLTLEPEMTLTLDGETVAGQHRPSANLLLNSLASAAGPGAVGVVLTGMGQDGREGVEAILERGGSVIAQDEASSAVYGMPKAAADAGADVVPLSRIAGTLGRLAKTEPVA